VTAGDTAFDRLVAALEPLGGLRLRGDHADARCPAHEDRSPSLSIDRGDGRALVHCHAGCSVEQVVTEYPDEQGRLLFVCRTADKQFPQWRPDPLKHHGRRWKLDGVRRVLCRLPEVIGAIERGARIFVCEGEKDVEAVERAGGVATTNPGGEGKDATDDLAGHGLDDFMSLDEVEDGAAELVVDVERFLGQISATGAELLADVHAAFTRYLIFPTPEAADAVTLWTAATHAQPAWEHATRLVIKSPLKHCGKTRLQEVIADSLTTCSAP
jgi:hypothetical protein